MARSLLPRRIQLGLKLYEGRVMVNYWLSFIRKTTQVLQEMLQKYLKILQRCILRKIHMINKMVLESKKCLNLIMISQHKISMICSSMAIIKMMIYIKINLKQNYITVLTKKLATVSLQEEEALLSISHQKEDALL